MQKFTPFLWFEDKAEEAVQFYTSIFKNSKVGRIARYGDARPGPKGQVMVVDFQIAGQEFVALNGGPQFVLGQARRDKPGGSRDEGAGRIASASVPVEFDFGHLFGRKLPINKRAHWEETFAVPHTAS